MRELEIEVIFFQILTYITEVLVFLYQTEQWWRMPGYKLLFRTLLPHVALAENLPTTASLTVTAVGPRLDTPLQGSSPTE